MLNTKAEIQKTIFLVILIFNLKWISIQQVVKMDPTIVPKFQSEIRNLMVAQPFSKDYYILQAQKKNVKILPDSMNLTTQMYVFTSIGGDGSKTDSAKIMVRKNQQVSITWINNIEGGPIVPIDTTLNQQIPKQLYETEVPMVTHMHGVTTTSDYDGHPRGYYTKSGKHGPSYVSNSSFIVNAATFVYENKNLFGYYYFHDHTLSMTRSNVISGLKGVYQIVSVNQTQEQQLIKAAFGEMETLELLIYDTKLQQNGSIYYHQPSSVQNYVWWTPQYFGDMMVVNGKAWPFWNVYKKIYRLVIMNACNSRYLNLYFQDSAGKNISYYIIKKDAGYLNKPVLKQNNGLINPFGRMELIIDFSQATGDVIMRNNAQTPLLVGDPVVPDLDGQMMKFKINATNLQNTSTFTKNYTLGLPYPKFPKGKILPLMIIQLDDKDDNPLKMLFNGQNMLNGKMCQNRVFQRGEIYDLYVFNPTNDEHPIHIHLVTHQVIGKYQINSTQFLEDFEKINGKVQVQGLSECAQFPKIQNYLIGQMIPPNNEQKTSSDITNVAAGYVTILRLAMIGNDRKILDEKFNGAYPIHCHMLQHEDNELMSFFHVVTKIMYVQNNLNSKSSSKNITSIREVYDGAAVKKPTLNSSSFNNNQKFIPIYVLLGVIVVLITLILLLQLYHVFLQPQQIKKQQPQEIDMSASHEKLHEKYEKYKLPDQNPTQQDANSKIIHFPVNTSALDEKLHEKYEKYKQPDQNPTQQDTNSKIISFPVNTSAQDEKFHEKYEKYKQSDQNQSQQDTNSKIIPFPIGFRQMTQVNLQKLQK